MKILILANEDIGLYKFRKELISKLITKNEIYISLPDGEKIAPLVAMGCKFIDTEINRRGVNPITDLKLIKKYVEIINQIKPDKVITYTIKPNIYGGIVCWLKNIQMYANVTGLGTAFQGTGLLANLVTTLYKLAFKKVTTVFFENEENRDIIVGKGIVPKEKTHCLHGAGVNIEEYAFSDYPEDGTIHFLFIGRIMREKGVDELLNAAERLKNDGVDVVVDIVGRFEDDYKVVVETLDKCGIIKYHGYQSDVKPFIKQAHCFVLPSWHEGMANTLLECGAMGRPLITSNIHGCLEAVQDGVTGYLCKVKDVDDLYKKMKQFIELPHEKKAEMGKQSHEYVASVFDKKKVVEDTVREIMR